MSIRLKHYLCALFCAVYVFGFGQSDTEIIRKIFDEAYRSQTSEKDLKYLCKKAPGRLVCSPESEKAVQHLYKRMLSLNLDSVWLQAVESPFWKVNKPSELYFTVKGKGKIKLNVNALGGSVSTPDQGLVSEMVEVQSFEHLDIMGEKELKGKLVFFNTPMDSGYGKTVKYRTLAAAKAGTYGAIGVVVYSLTTRKDDYPHTGSMHYVDGIDPIPAVMVSSNDAFSLHQLLHADPELKFTLKVHTEDCGTCITHNVIGEIQGSEYPDKVILVGGHVDAWFNTEGANDNAAGCIHALDVLKLYKALKIKPKHTIRAVMFMDEEYRQTGSKAYAKWVNASGQEHIVALESDAGAFEPEAFGVNASDSVLSHLKAYEKYFSPYYPLVFEKGYGGVDIMPLKQLGTPLIGYAPNDDDYFYFHHCAYDTYEMVNYRYLQAGSANFTSLIYLIDHYGL